MKISREDLRDLAVLLDEMTACEASIELIEKRPDDAAVTIEVTDVESGDYHCLHIPANAALPMFRAIQRLMHQELDGYGITVEEDAADAATPPSPTIQ